jgi:hypothetical protein
VITLARRKRFGLVYVGQKALKGKKTVGRVRGASSVVMPTIHSTSFRSLTIITPTNSNAIFIVTNRLSHMIIILDAVHHLESLRTDLAKLDHFLSSDTDTRFSRAILLEVFLPST